MTGDIQQKLEHYLNRPYTFQVETHEEGGGTYYSIRVLELDGCITTGDTLEEVARDIKDAMREWLQLNIKLGKAIPEPLKSRVYNGKVMLRMTPSLHEALMLRALEEGVSLNQYLISSLSQNLGYERGLKQNKESGYKTFAAVRERRETKPV